MRCVGNLIAEDEANTDELLIKEECLLKALFVFMQYFLPIHTFVVSECLWLMNNLTGMSPEHISDILVQRATGLLIFLLLPFILFQRVIAWIILRTQLKELVRILTTV